MSHLCNSISPSLVYSMRTCHLSAPGSIQENHSVCFHKRPLWFKGNQQLNFNNLSTDLVALWHAGSSQIREWTHVPCVGRELLYHWGTREAPNHLFLISCAKNIHGIYRQQCFLCTDYFGGFYPHEYWTFIKEYFYKEFKTIISQIGDFMFANSWNCILCILNGI